MQAFYTENFDFSEAGFIRINQIRTFSKHLFKKKSIPFCRHSSFYTNKNTHTLNEFMEASWRVNNKKKKRNIPGKMMVLLLKKRKNICFTSKIHKRPAIAVIHLGFFFLFFSTPTPLYSNHSIQFFSSFFCRLPSPPFFGVWKWPFIGEYQSFYERKQSPTP